MASRGVSNLSIFESPAVQGLRVCLIGTSLRRLVGWGPACSEIPDELLGPQWFESELVLGSSTLRHYLAVEGLITDTRRTERPEGGLC